MANAKRRKYDVLVNMINGETVVIDNIDKNGKVTFTNGTTAENLDVYRFIKNDSELPTPEEVVVSNGEMTIDGVAIESGSLHLEEVMAISPGNVMLVVRGLDEKKKDVFNYKVEDDRFEKVINAVDEVKVLYKNGVTLFSTTKKAVRDVEVIDEETGEILTEEVMEESQRLNVYKDYIVASLDLEAPLPTFRAVEFPNKTVLIGRTKFTHETREDVLGRTFETIVPLEKGENVIQLVIEKSTLTYEVYEEVTEDKILVEKVTPYVEYVDAAVKHVELVHDGKDNLLIVTEEGVIFTNYGYGRRIANGNEAVEVALTHPHLIALRPGRTYNEFRLSDKAGNVVSISVTKTADRGYITEIKGN